MVLRLEKARAKRKCHACDETIQKDSQCLKISIGWGREGTSKNVCMVCLKKLASGEDPGNEEAFRGAFDKEDVDFG